MFRFPHPSPTCSHDVETFRQVFASSFSLIPISLISCVLELKSLNHDNTILQYKFTMVTNLLGGRLGDLSERGTFLLSYRAKGSRKWKVNKKVISKIVVLVRNSGHKQMTTTLSDHLDLLTFEVQELELAKGVQFFCLCM